MGSNKPDWSQKCWRDMLIYQRKSIYREDTLEKLAAWMGFKPGFTVVDVGCGLGYLGYTYWKYFGRGGKYVGVDNNTELLTDAQKSADKWAVGGEAEFIEADAYTLPLEDDFADLVMCQTLLMHLNKPADALAEMVRVVKPGGWVVCKEPDNLSAMMAVPIWSLPEFELEDLLLSRKVYYLANEGRIKLGRGDMSIGRKVPHMFSQLGLTGIDIRLNDRVHMVEPPYESEMQRDILEKVRQEHLDETRRRILMEREREEFLAGGGTNEEYDRIEAISDKYFPIFKNQIDNKTYYSCGIGCIYISKGQKPAE